MTAEGSTVSLIYDVDGPGELDIANHAVIVAANFSVSAGATPGPMEVLLRDPDRNLSFITGKRVKLIIDGQTMWSGFTFIKGMGSFFPAGDGKVDTRTRSWSLKGVDNNTLWDRRILYEDANFLKKIPNIKTNRYDGYLLRTALANYTSMPSWLDITNEIDDIVVPAGQSITAAKPWAWPQVGSKMRVLAEDLARWSAAAYYIGPDDKVHYHAARVRESAWGFSDRPNYAPITTPTGFQGSYWGFRELSAEEDGSGFATDAFVWGGSPFAGSGQTVYARATDEDLEEIYGKWQMAETRFNETNYKLQAGVTQRANMIVFGNPDGTPGGAEPGSVVGEGPRGLRFPQWSYSLSWFGHRIPKIAGVPQHLYPGDILPIQLWAFSQDEGETPLTKFLPLQSLGIRFFGARDGKAFVQFNGTFDLRNDDNKFIWKFLQKREPAITKIAAVGITDDSDDSPFGGYAQLTPLEAADSSRTVFTIKFPYIPNTTQVYADTGDGLTLRLRGSYYTESDPDAAEIEFAVAPTTGTDLFVVCRTQAS